VIWLAEPKLGERRLEGWSPPWSDSH
jgi:hypothetical protein